MSNSADTGAAGSEARPSALTPHQHTAAMADGPVLVPAGAGTVAVARRIRVGGITPNRVLAVTFTNKAAAEMSSCAGL
jgi:DNA helicase II / ATP-dependent DNA helicase PcrA